VSWWHDDGVVRTDLKVGYIARAVGHAWLLADVKDDMPMANRCWCELAAGKSTLLLHAPHILEV